MKRNESIVVDRIERYCRDKDVLEIGCGDGTRLATAARVSSLWKGIDPDASAIRQAIEAHCSSNAEFVEGNAENLAWPDSSFDVVIFTLSLHHIDFTAMPKAIDEAVRVVRSSGSILFLEPLPVGTFYDAEMRFACCDGDERRELAFAFYTMLSAQRLHEVEEFVAQVSFEHDSFDDFKLHVPTKDGTHPQLEQFLSTQGFKLDEEWRLNVFRVAD